MEIAQGIGRAPISSCFPNLVDVLLYRCGLPNLSWLVHAPKLRKLHVKQCPSIERIIGDGVTREELAASGLFSSLERLVLEDLPKLTSICDHALSFPHGASFQILGCPGLIKLPLDSNDASGRSFSITGDKDWWAKFVRWAKFEWNPTGRVTLKHSKWGLVEEMAFGEAVHKMKDDGIYQATIGFGPSGSGLTV
ncbi:uncharacterized protein J3R85_000885 [Psidium guajava]|nr:uncharacterized protein J3R85_000885 [Psidium guajava]